MAQEETVKLKKGDYTVHIFIEHGRGLLPLGDSGKIDPIVSFKVFGKEKCTKALDDVGTGATIFWGEHFYFSKENATASEIEQQRLTIEVRDHRFLLKNSLVGCYEMDLTYVYYQKDHTIFHQWIGLSNPEAADFSVVRGYLKLGISVLHESDKAVDLTVPEKPGATEEMLLPPQVKPKTVQLVVRFLKAEQLPKMDRMGTADAYCIAKFSGVEHRTSVITVDEATMSAYWYEEVYLPVMQPCVATKLQITVLDHDTASPNDDLIGSISFSWDKILNGDYKDNFWANIYGAPPRTDNDESKLMNSIPEMASYWRGRLLMSIFVDEEARAVLKVEKVAEEGIKEKVQQEFEVGEMYEVRAQVFSAIALPDKTGKYGIKVRWAEIELSSTEMRANNGCCKWYESLNRKTTLIPNRSELILPDVFIYLNSGGSNVCYARLSAKECMKVDKDEQWIRFNPDKAINSVKNDWEGGFIKIKVYIGKLSEQKLVRWNRPEQRSEVGMTLLCHLFQCKNLPSSDANGSADPYVVMYCAGSQVNTDKKAKPNTLNPMWYETLAMEISVEPDTSTPVIIYVWDYDLTSKDDLMGMCIVNMKEIERDTRLAPRPRWYKLDMGKPGTEEGEILMSFSLQQSGNVPYYSLVPKSTEVTVEINILGLRDLKPAVGWMPVNKAFMKFDLKSLQLPGESLPVQELRTQPFEPGPNPNINTVLSFTCMIPKDPLYCPALNCTVHDYVLYGLSQPLLGTFTIQIGELLIKKDKRAEARKRASINMNRFSTALIPPKIDEEQRSAAFNRYSTQYPAIKIEDEKEEPRRSFDSLNPFKVVEEANEDEYEEEEKDFEPLFSVVQRRKETLVRPFLPKASEGGGDTMRSLFNTPRASIREEVKVEEMQVDRVVIYPQFVDDPRKKRKVEVGIPNPDEYCPLGYNREPDDGKKHYRYYIKGELEKSIFMDGSPFDQYDLIRGQSRGLGGIIDTSNKLDEQGQKTNIKSVGKFKGLIRVIQEKSHKRAIAMMEEEEDEIESKEFEEIGKLLLTKTECVVRVYVIQAFDLEQKDINSASDPYLVLKLGNKVINQRDKYQLDEPNPIFNEVFELNTTLPGDSILKIKLMDYDDILSDDKIGTTKIDLEDRFFSNKWKELPYKPIETRPLYVKSSRRPQGYVRLWLEIFSSKNRDEPLDISAKPPVKYEARVIIWRSEDVPNGDPEGVSDLYVRAWINNMPPKETDTHYRCQNGRGSWNWRLKFPLELNGRSSNIMNLQLWDRDFFSSNDIMGDASIDFNDIAMEAYESGGRVKKLGSSENWQDRALRRENEKFWVEFKKTNPETGKSEYTGKVLMSFELVPEQRALSCPVGEGRSEPNLDPFLPPPTGRLELSWNPVKMVGQMCGPEFKTKICQMVCVVLCLLMCIFMFPMIISNSISNIMFG